MGTFKGFPKSESTVHIIQKSKSWPCVNVDHLLFTTAYPSSTSLVIYYFFSPRSNLPKYISKKVLFLV